MRIEVTQEDIDNRGRSGWNCPLCLGIKRAIGIADDLTVWVSFNQVAIGNEVFTLPRVAAAFRWDYDHAGRVRPFVFPLPIDHLIGATP